MRERQERREGKREERGFAEHDAEDESKAWETE